MAREAPTRYAACMVARILAVILLLVLPASAQTNDANELEFYPVGDADPQALVVICRNLAGPEGQVTLDRTGQRLMVLTTRDRQARIAELFRVDAPAPLNIRLDIRFRGRGVDTRSGADLGASGGVVYEDGISHGTFKLRPRVENRTTTTSSDTVQTLVVANGRSGSLRIGEDIPYLDWILDYGYREGVLRQGLVWQQVGSFLAVEATVVGEGPMVRLRVTPELRGLVAGRPEHARFAAVSTEVVVQEGQPFALGGLSSANEFFSRFLVGYGRGGRQESLDISVTAHIVKARTTPGPPIGPEGP